MGLELTDPGYGSLLNYEGNKGELLLKEAVYRIDPKTAKVEKVTDMLYKPNGICFSPDGERIGLILLPEICSNVCFGGAKRNRLFMTASQSLYAIYVETRGAHIT